MTMNFRYIKKSILLIFTILCVSNSVSAQYDSLTMDWWNELDSSWQERFKKNGNLRYHIDETELKRLYDLSSMNCTGIDDWGEEIEIKTLEPVRFLDNLEEIDCSYAQIHDLTPLVNLTKLEESKSDLDKRKRPRAIGKIAEFEGIAFVKHIGKVIGYFDCSTEIRIFGFIRFSFSGF